MTVKELIDELQKVEDKNIKVGYIEIGADEYGYADYDNTWIEEITFSDLKDQENEQYLVLQ